MLCDRSAPHCIEYAHLIQWGKERPAEDFDPDIEEHMKWVFDKAVLRAEQFGIPVLTFPTYCTTSSSSILGVLQAYYWLKSLLRSQEEMGIQAFQISIGLNQCTSPE